jgi:hypothetical protein
MSIENFLAVGDDQIDYTALDAATLLRLATQEEEPYIATSALGELGARRDPAAPVACTSVLDHEIWDRHLYAFALTTLFQLEHSQALERMQRLLDTTEEAVLIDAMAECVASDLDYFGHGSQRAFADALAARLLATSISDNSGQDDRTAVLARYGAHRVT